MRTAVASVAESCRWFLHHRWFILWKPDTPLTSGFTVECLIQHTAELTTIWRSWRAGWSTSRKLMEPTGTSLGRTRSSHHTTFSLSMHALLARSSSGVGNGAIQKSPVGVTIPSHSTNSASTYPRCCLAPTILTTNEN